ncbi:MAG: homoserine dehydrogenase [Candidatus Altiarchaeota archaeon]
MRIILVGFGVIGRGLAETLLCKRRPLAENGVKMKVVALCEKNGSAVNPDGLDLKKALNDGVESLAEWGGRKTMNVIEDVNADIVVELTPGSISDGGVGLKHIRQALKSGKSVVTSNKSPLVVAYEELTDLAGREGLELKFEATVCGAIPLISLCKNQLKASGIKNIHGVFNGTTNYILSKMSEEGVEFEAALKEAQLLGYAETNPEYDVKGIDTAAKVVILANSILGLNAKYSDVTVTGVDKITSESIELADKHGYVIKLIGDAAKLEVSPMLVPKDHPLNVSGTLNSVLIETDTAGDITLVGAGAGPLETSSAILSDILEVAGRMG